MTIANYRYIPENSNLVVTELTLFFIDIYKWN